MTNKVTLRKKIKKLDLAELNMDYEQGEYWVEVWDDPSKSLVLDLLGVVLISSNEMMELSKEEQDELYDDFLNAIVSIFIDTNIDGLDFSSKESIKESMSSELLPWGFLYDLTVHYTTWLLLYHEKIKKVLRLSSAAGISGGNKEIEVKK